MSALTPADADMFWHSRHRVSDQFGLYCFAAQADSDPEMIARELAARMRGLDDFAVRVAPAPGGPAGRRASNGAAG